jgi:hypothetical protein
MITGTCKKSDYPHYVHQDCIDWEPLTPPKEEDVKHDQSTEDILREIRDLLKVLTDPIRPLPDPGDVPPIPPHTWPTYPTYPTYPTRPWPPYNNW